MKVVKIKRALRRLERVNEEISYVSCAQGRSVTAGLIVFKPTRRRSLKQIKHRGLEVLCHVIKGRGRLRIKKRTIALEPGTVCYIPRRTPHDFAAGKSGPLVLLYAVIETG